MLSRFSLGLRRAASPAAFSPVLTRFFSTAGQYDVVVVGGGPGGYVAAIKAGQLGMKVACVEKRGSLGGTCLNVGCIPSKALLHSTHMYEQAVHEGPKHGLLNVENLGFSVAAMLKQKEAAVTQLTKGIEGLFKKNKVDYVRGAGKLTGLNEITATLTDGGVQKLNSKNIIIATGSEPTPLPSVPVAQRSIVTSTGALSLSEVPKKLIVIGGGYIGLEMGSVWRRLGSEVTVVEYLDRIVPAMDLEVGKQFHKLLEKQKMKFMLSTKVTGSQVSDAGVRLTIEPSQGGQSQQLEADVVLVATGRRPYTANLGLQELGIKMDKAGRIETNHSFQTNIPHIYAIGDVIAGPMLAHKAEEEGIAAVEILAGRGGHVNYNCIPSVVYTHPEVASVGKTEEQLKAENVKYRVGKFPFVANSRAKTNADYDGFVKILSDQETDRILGIHIIGPNAGEMIAEGVLGMEYGAASEDIARTCHAHPTLSEAFKEAAMAAYDKPIHF